MKNISFVLVGLVICVSFGDLVFADSQLWQNKAEREIADVVQQMFNALGANKFDKYEKLVTQDFYLYDVGKRFSRDAFADVIKKDIAKGVKFNWVITEPEAHVSNNVAWVTYKNRGSFESHKGKQQKTWLESAVLEREGKHWRIRFLHSTLVTN